MRAQDLPEVALRTEILAERLGRLQRTLASRGKKLVVILSPSKSVIYPDEVPTDWRRAPEYRSDLEIHDLFTSAMQRHGVLLADGHALLAGKTGADRDLVYTRTGRHWTELGACLVLRDAFLGGPVTPTCAYELTLPDRTRSGDYDLYRLLNLWRSNEVPAPVPQVTEIAREGLAPRPRTLFIGTSFMWILAKIMRPLIEAPIAFYYNITVFDVAGQPRPIEPVDPASPRWTGYALDRDLYVLEILETYAYGDEPIKFADSMLERLR